jgi:hypothetical protein
MNAVTHSPADALLGLLGIWFTETDPGVRDASQIATVHEVRRLTSMGWSDEAIAGVIAERIAVLPTPEARLSAVCRAYWLWRSDARELRVLLAAARHRIVRESWWMGVEVVDGIDVAARSEVCG